MKATVMGVSEIYRGDASKKTGRPYHGQQLHLSYPKRGVEGQAVMTQYVDYTAMTGDLPTFRVGDNVSVDFDSNGRLLEISPVVVTGFGSMSIPKPVT